MQASSSRKNLETFESLGPSSTPGCQTTLSLHSRRQAFKNEKNKKKYYGNIYWQLLPVIVSVTDLSEVSLSRIPGGGTALVFDLLTLDGWCPGSPTGRLFLQAPEVYQIKLI